MVCVSRVRALVCVSRVRAMVCVSRVRAVVLSALPSEALGLAPLRQDQDLLYSNPPRDQAK